MTTLATASSLREATSPEALTRARRRLLTAHPDPTRANTPTPGSLTDEQLRLLAVSDWVPPRIAALGANTIATADAITRALLAESVRESLERRLTTERPNGTYDDTRAGHDAFSRGVVEDYDHGNHHLARATIRPADPGLVTRAALSVLGLPDTDAPLSTNSPRRRTPTRSRASSPTLPCSILTGTPPGQACSTRASEPPSCSRRQTNSAWPTPSMPSPRPARHDRSPRAQGRPPLPRSAIFCAPHTRRLTPRQKERLREAFTADEAHISVDVAYLHRASVRGLPPSRTRPRPTPGRTLHPAPTSLSHPRNRSPRGEPYASGRTHSTTTSIPTEQATAPRKPSTDIIELGRRIARGYRNPTIYQL